LSHQWKESVIVPIYKKGHKTDCSNYKGMPLLPTTHKVVNIILSSSLTPYVGKIIGGHQYEFRRNRSATDHIVILHSSDTGEK